MPRTSIYKLEASVQTVEGSDIKIYNVLNIAERNNLQSLPYLRTGDYANVLTGVSGYREVYTWDKKNTAWVLIERGYGNSDFLRLCYSDETEFNANIAILNSCGDGGENHARCDVSFSQDITCNLDKIKLFGEGKYHTMNGHVFNINSTTCHFEEYNFMGNVYELITNSQKLINIIAKPASLHTSRYFLKRCNFYDYVGTSGVNYPLIEINANNNLSCHLQFEQCSHRIRAYNVDYTLIKNSGNLLDFTMQVINHLNQSWNSNKFSMGGNLASNTTICRLDTSVEYVPGITANVEFIHKKTSYTQSFILDAGVAYNINHMLNRRVGAIVYDNNNDVVDLNIKYINLNTIALTSEIALSGYVVCN